jgi:hypothetical protein
MSEHDVNSTNESPKSPSRREWLLRLGETAMLAGVSGVLGEAKSQESEATVSQPAAPLPPGLFDPSYDHLTHALSSDSRLVSIPAGSPTDYVRPRQGPFQPKFFAPQEFQLVSRIVELIIGDAAVVEEVAEWIDLRLSRAPAVREAAAKLSPDQRALATARGGSRRFAQLETDYPEKTYRDGLEWLGEQSRERHQKSFLDLDQGQQLELLSTISDDRTDKSQENAGTRFFLWIKRETILGYYTSQTGLKELNYRGNAFYAEPPGCEEP